jgi:LytTr DNA-binding domain
VHARSRLHSRSDPERTGAASRPGSVLPISRATIVNLDCVTDVKPLIGGMAEVVLNTGVRLEVSRRRVKDLLQRLGGEDLGKETS